MRSLASLRILRPLAVLAAGVFAACGSGGGGAAALPTTGGLEVRLHDHPIKDLEHVYVTIERVDVYRIAEVEGEEQEIKETVTSVPGQYDLLELQHGVEAVLGDGQFEPGNYKWIRLVVARDSKHDMRTVPAVQLKNYVVVKGKAYPLEVPSGEQTGIKLGRNFTIEAGVTTVLTMDFDLRRSVHRCGRNHVYRLRPRIRVVPTVHESDGPAVSGHVSTTDGTGVPAGAVVSAQQGGVEIASAEVDAAGDYAFPALDDGTYDLVLIAPGADYAAETGVVVAGGSGGSGHDFATKAASTGAVYGTVTFSGDLMDVTVRLRWNGFTVATVAVDPTTGEYVMDGIAAGGYTIEAQAGEATTSSSVTVVGFSAVQVDLGL